MAKLTNTFKARVQKWAIQRLGAYPYRNSWWKTKACPYCGREQKFGINFALNRCNCFRCGKSPSLPQLVMDVENLEFAEVNTFLNQDRFEGLVYKEEQVEIRTKQDIYLPEGFMLLNQGESKLTKIMQNYVRKRGFNIDELSKAGWGYGTKDKYFGYLIIPFHEQGHLVYFNARSVVGSGPRYQNPEVSTTGIGKSFLIYNKDALYMYNSVFLCEGAINAQTMGERGIASGGKMISQYQINEIIKSPCKRIIILFDSDAKEQAIDLALKLVDYKRVKVILFKDERDPNDLGQRATRKLIYSVRYQNSQELLKLKHNLK